MAAQCVSRMAGLAMAAIVCMPLVLHAQTSGTGSSASTASTAKASSRLAGCATCHGDNGNSRIKDTPSLAGQPSVFIETQLVMIREGLRDVPAMKGTLDGVSDAEIAGLARYYAAQPVVSSSGQKQSALFEQGRQLAGKMQCGSCHLPTYVGREQMPRLAGQREDYLFNVMKAFRENRTTGRDTIMTAAVYGTTDAELKALAHYLTHVK